MDNRKISLCLTNYNRVELLFESFTQVIGDERISEIVISDDCSELSIYQQIKGTVSALNAIYNDKIKLSRTINNRDCYENKMVAISLASNEWVIIFDSDNILDKSYLDRLFEIPTWDNETAYCPVWAKPTFNYTAFSGLTINKENISQYVNEPMFLTALNTFNCFFNRDNYLKTFDSSLDPITSDSIYFMYCWLVNGFGIHFVNNLFYEHKIHDGSHYRINNVRTGLLAAEIEEKVKQLK